METDQEDRPQPFRRGAVDGNVHQMLLRPPSSTGIVEEEDVLVADNGFTITIHLVGQARRHRPFLQALQKRPGLVLGKPGISQKVSRLIHNVDIGRRKLREQLGQLGVIQRIPLAAVLQSAPHLPGLLQKVPQRHLDGVGVRYAQSLRVQQISLAVVQRNGGSSLHARFPGATGFLSLFFHQSKPSLKQHLKTKPFGRSAAAYIFGRRSYLFGPSYLRIPRFSGKTYAKKRKNLRKPYSTNLGYNNKDRRIIQYNRNYIQ